MLKNLLRLFESSALAEPPAVSFPYPVDAVPGKEALARWSVLRERATESGEWPIILGGERELPQIEEFITGFAGEATPSSEDFLRSAASITPSDWFARKQAEMLSDGASTSLEEASLERWPSARIPSHEPSVHRETLTRRIKPWVFIARLPTREPWATSAYLKNGGWNDCPAPDEQIAIMRHWHERFGAVPIANSHDVMEFEVARPPATREAALELAREQYLFCYDIVEQGVGTIPALAASLLDAKYWYFWWD